MLPATFRCTRWLVHLRTSVVALCIVAVTSCDTRPPITGPSTDGESPGSPSSAPSLAIAYSGGIPFGLYNIPTSKMGSDFNGKMTNARIWLPTSTIPNLGMAAELEAIKSRGGKVILNMAGSHVHVLDANGRFSLTKWKQRIDAFRPLRFGSYINDGTIIAHHVIDEPNDASNWGGVPIPPATVEEMARYSKQIWPNMPTVARVESSYLAKWTGTYRYLDAAWAQWVARKGDPGEFITRNVADAKRKGLALITGLNVLKGDFREPLSPSLIRSAGTALLRSTYPCAFLSWQYDAEYLATPGVRDALRYLRQKALGRTYKTCRS